MKRPLCIVCGVLILCIVLFVRGFPPHIPVSEKYDGEEILLSGKIINRERHISNKEETTVIYLKSVQTADIYSQKFPVRETGSQEEKENQIKGIICYLKPDSLDSDMRIGAQIHVKGSFQAIPRAGNPGEFDAALYYYAQGFSGRLFQAEVISEGREYSRIREALSRFRGYLERQIDRVYEGEEAGLLKAVLLGSKAEVDSGVKELYQRSGIIHILAISGLHISVLGMGLYRLLRRLTVPVTPSAVISFVFLLLYGAMAGNGISIVRAVGMFGIKGLGKIWGRTYDLVTALALMGLFLLIEQPLYACHSGYWLSFGSVAGIGVIYPAAEKLFVFGKPSGGIKAIAVKGGKMMTQMLLSGLSVTIMTAPVMLWFYYEIPVYSVILNLLVIPVMTVVLVLGVTNLCYLLALGGLTWPVFLLPAKGIGTIHHWIFELFEGLCLLNEKLPGHTVVAGKPALLQVFLFYACLAGALILVQFRLRSQFRSQFRFRSGFRFHSCSGFRFRYTAAFGLVLAAFLILFYKKGIGFSAAALDTGQGNTGVILYEDTAFIIDAGSSSRKDTGKNVLIPYLKYHGISKVEAVFVTHPDEDHYNGVLELLEKARGEGLTVGRLVLPEIRSLSVSGGPAMQKLVQAAEAENIPVLYASKGLQLKRGDVTIRCLHPDGKDYGEDSNSYSQVLLIKYHLFSMLFMGDAQGEAEKDALEAMKEMQTGKVTVLQVGHHGSEHGTKEGLLSYLEPRMAVISCGKGNRYGHPHPTVLKRLEKAGSKVHITWMTGAVIINTDGKSMRIKKFRESFP